jgi:hypothetical protein
LAASGRLAIDGLEDGRLRGESVIRLDTARAGDPPTEPAQIQAAVATDPKWSAALTGLTMTSDAGREWVTDLLRHLQEDGLSCLWVSDLVSAIASRAREDWAARHAARAGDLAHEGDDETCALVPLIRPDESVEIRDQIAILRRVVPERIAQERQLRVRNGLTVVFREWIRMIEEGGISRPSQTELAERVGMSDATLSDYLRRLRQMLETILSQTRMEAPPSG